MDDRRGSNGLPPAGFSVGLEENPARGTRVHSLDLLGCAAEGASPEAALDAFSAELNEWLRFLQESGTPVPDPRSEVEIRVDEWISTEVDVLAGQSDACFGADLRPLGPREIDAGLQRFGDLRGRLLRTVRSADPVTLDVEPASAWSARRILDELARAEWWTLTRLGASPLAQIPDRTLGRLDTAAALIVAAFTGRPDSDDARLIEIEGESWTPRKVLRRLLWLEWSLGRAAILAIHHAERELGSRA
jgi:predicted RNase H-like HicB family nuclease